MASSKSSWHDDEMVSHWRRVREIGMEEGLRQIGCSEYLISEVFDFGREQHLFWWTKLMERLGNAASEMVRATILATVGRCENFTKEFHFKDEILTEPELIAFCVNISSNTKIETLVVLGEVDPRGEPSALYTVEGCTALGRALASNCSVNYLFLPPALLNTEAGRFLFDGLRSNKILKEILLDGGLLTARGVRLVAEFVTSNSVLKTLFMNLDLDYEAAELMSSALSRNTNLRVMRFRIRQRQSDSLAKLLQPFSGQARDDTASSSDLKNVTITELNLDLTELDLDLTEATEDWLESAVQLIRSNRSLTQLSLRISLPPQEWKKQIFPALKTNETISLIDLFGSKGLEGDDVFEALLDVLQNTESKTRLKKFRINDTGLQSKQAQVNEELRINKQYRYALRGQKSEPTTFGRLVMCGFQYAGKTTICEAAQRIDSGIKGNHLLTTRWKRLFLQTCPSLGGFVCGEDAYMELQKRTRGCDIMFLMKQNHLKAIWDFAGQKEYYALHDYLFPDAKNSCFLYVCSCRTSPTKENPTGKIKDMKKIKSECEYWLKFVASNSKPYFIGDGQGQQLPTVIFVFTKLDTLGYGDARVSQGWARTVVCELQGKFKNVLNLCDEVKVVNALQDKDVNALLAVVSDQLGKTLNHQREYNLCRDIRDIFYRWSLENPLKPIMDIQDFNRLCKQQFFPREEVPPGSAEKWEVVLTYFDDIGEIIFLKGLSFIVTNPRWFGVGILGYLIDSFKGVQVKSSGMFCCCCFPKTRGQSNIMSGVYLSKGVVESSRMEIVLENSLKTTHLEQSITAEQLIELMSKLEMCFKVDEGSVNSCLFVPALFDDAQESAARGERQLAWKMPLEGSLTYLGRRLQIENEYATFLSPGFFPRLQVHLRNYVHRKRWTHNPAFTVVRNLIQFSEDGAEVCVEYSGGTDYFIDILVQSQKSYEKALKFVEDEVVYTIRRFCASPQGCQGVTLVEAVIRPYCVEGLHMCKDRKAHSVLVSKLQQKLEVEGKDSIHTWSEELEDASPTDYILDLLEGDSAYEPLITSEMAPRPSPRLEDSRSNGVKKRLMVELPKHFYPSIEDVNFLSKLNAALTVSKVLPIRLHILCDYTKCPHKVIGQPGREFQLNWMNGGYHLSIVKVAVSLLWTAVGLGTSMAGISHAGFSNVDKWIETTFAVEGMHTLDVGTLSRMNNPGKAMEKVSEEDILKALHKYWKIDPHTQDMKEFLKLEDGEGFWEDFQLRKVVYIEEPNQKIGWVCKKHFEEGLKRKRLQSTPH